VIKDSLFYAEWSFRTGTITGVDDKISLYQNYPNPFNPVTTINFSLAKSGLTTLKVYNLLGQEVATLVKGEMTPGNHSVKFDDSKLASGIYVYRITAGTFSSNKEMMLLK
jgi:hypothetical protein